MKFSLENISRLGQIGISRWFCPAGGVQIPVSRNLFSGIFEPIQDDGNYVVIKNFPVGYFLGLIKRKYNTHKLVNMFERRMFGTIRIHKFFLPELVYILSQGSGESTQKIIDRIFAKTWLRDLYEPDSAFVNHADLKRVEASMKVRLFDWQREFIEQYDIKRQRAHLNGELLSFGCGLGKTITSLALMEALGCDAVVIIAPKSTLIDVWEYHIKTFYKAKQKYYIVNKSTPVDAKFYVFNYESMDKIEEVMPYLRTKREVGIIVDESHNFLKMNSLRTQRLIQIRHDLNSQHCLLQSGTPVKALPVEIIPLLRIVDQMFDSEAEQTFRKAFGVNTELGADILHARLNLMMHRRQMEDVYKLPEKTETIIQVTIRDGKNYTIDNVKKELAKYAAERMKYHEQRMPIYREEWDRCIKYLDTQEGIAYTKEWDRYIRLVNYLRAHGYNNLDKQLIADVAWANNYEKGVLEPSMPKDLRDQFRDCKAAIKYLNMKLQGEVLGRLEYIRGRMTSAMLSGVKLRDIINDSQKKVIFFTSYVDTVDTLNSMLTKMGFKTVCVYGKTSKDANALLDKFRNDDSIRVLIATIQTLATGVTLVEANTTVFLNDPWRDADKEQASNRIWRIGQDAPCYIYTLHLNTGETRNLSDRSADILDWSKRMTDAIVKG